MTLSFLDGKLGFQVHFKELPRFWIEANLARDFCRSITKWEKNQLFEVIASWLNW